MNHKDILDAYRSGELTITEVEEQLQGIKRQSSKGPLSEGQKGLWMLQKCLLIWALIIFLYAFVSVRN